MLTSRRKRPLDRSEALRDARLIVIAAEGEKTEELYFNSFNNIRVKIRMISSVEGRSAPVHILSNMQMYIDEYQIGEGDELWLVIDRDAWHPKTLSRVATTCRQKNINLAVSNPCFELWLAHHLDAPLPDEITCKTLEISLRNALGGYNKSRYDADILISNVMRAIDNAQEFDKDTSKRWPDPIGSRVHLLVKSILMLQ